MQAALAEFKAEEIGQDQEEDIDFLIEKGIILHDVACDLFFLTDVRP